MNKYEEIIFGIRGLVRDGTVTENILKILYEHKCYFLLCRIKSNNKYVNLAKLESFIMSCKVTEYFMKCKEIFEFLNNSNIPYAVIKGPIISKRIYNNLYSRYFCDIDILVDLDNIDGIKKLMLSNNFVQGKIIDNEIHPFTREEIIFNSTMTHQISPFIQRTDNPICPFVQIDINTKIMWGESNHIIDTRDVLFNNEITYIGGYKLRVLSIEAEFIALCLHHYKDINSIYLLFKRGIRLYVFFDIYYYLVNNALDKEKLRFLIEKWNIGKYIYYCLFYTNLIFDDKIIQEYLHFFDDYKNVNIIESYGLNETELNKWNIDFYTRLFSNDLNSYISENLNFNNMLKIAQNAKYM